MTKRSPDKIWLQWGGEDYDVTWCEDNVNDEDVEYVIKKLDLAPQAFEEIMALPPKSFRDYPSYYPIFEKFGPIVKVAMKFALPWTPPMMHEMEVRKRKKQ